jgi:dipicolinate synthase subunit A
MNSILFAGGDARTLAAISYMKNQGFHVISYAVTARTPVDGSKASAVVLPFPCLKNGRLNAPALQNPPTVAEMIGETGIDPASAFVLGGPMADCPFARYTDLSQSEELKTRNAVTTAEGALDALIRNTDTAIFGLPVLVIGYGAIGKRLSHVLQALGARVTVAARWREHRVCGEYAGYTVQDTKNLSLQGIHLPKSSPFSSRSSSSPSLRYARIRSTSVCNRYAKISPVSLFLICSVNRSIHIPPVDSA